MYELDCKGIACPMPIVKISRKIKEMAPGESLCVLSDDAAFKIDVEAWAKKTENSLISIEIENNVTRAVIQKRED